MDIALVTGAVGALKTALEIGKTAVALRDASKLNEVVIAMNEQLLNAQQSLFMHNAQLMALQQEHFHATQELRELKEAQSDRLRYTLFEIARGHFVYRADARPAAADASHSVASEPNHYICQPCFDGPARTRIVLRGSAGAFKDRKYTRWACPQCKSWFNVQRA